ncbi:alpha/beta hydrolase family protein [Mariniflexile sp. HMF6888]|uniref:alpha/beta hydrolase family protein n=1 Tax=Mariniflexile sp. HMF6888 TaxID=3373086 RepID=UPI00379D2638
MKKTITITLLLFCAINTQIYPQSETDNTQQKRYLTPKDYNLWNRLSGQEISNNGDWYAYSLHNSTSRESTLFVGATKTDAKYHFPFGSNGQFSNGSKWFTCIVPKKGLGILDLERGATRWISNVSKFELSSDDKYLIASIKPMASTEQPSLLIIDLTTGKQETIVGVVEYQIHPLSNKLAYILDMEGKKSVVLHTLEAAPKTTGITENKLYTYKKLRWSSNGTALVFLQEAPEGSEKQKRHKLYYYNTKQGQSKLKCLDPTIDTALFGGMDIGEYKLKISQDGSVVFFEVVDKKNLDMMIGENLPDSVQVWNTKDKRIYHRLKLDQLYGLGEFGLWKTSWWPLKDKTMVLETKALPEAEVSINGTYMLSYNPIAYAPHFKMKGDIDLYLTNLETGEQSLFLKQQEYGENGFKFNVQFSSTGKYINYFRDKHWWIYDLEKKTHTNATKGLAVQLYKTEDDGADSGGLEPYEGHGRTLYWTNEDKELVIFDRYDVWLISPKGKARKLTNGKEKQIRHRFEPNFYKEGQLDPSQGMVFRTFGTTDKASGYAVWKPTKGIKDIVYKDMHVTELKKAKDRKAYIYKEESFETSPRIKYWEKDMSEAGTLLETNPQQKQFHWGKAELIHYTGPEGQPLQGALFYPANYKLGEKYPMIVNIYEQLSDKLHIYEAPTEYLGDGFNRTNYTADGYLVFLPDIKYKFNDPGISAVQCVEAGVRAVFKKGIVEEDHIGLIGHSFGGYETVFVVTQTDMFATAIAGAANTDLVSMYHSIAVGDYDISRMFWFESQQWRFTDSFYQNPEAYLRNSPLHHAANINIPLLLWTGGKDARTDWRQSIELYMGLRRLGKDATLLLYPDEAHGIRNKSNAVDLTRRMKAWFDKYLKPDRASLPTSVKN